MSAMKGCRPPRHSVTSCCILIWTVRVMTSVGNVFHSSSWPELWSNSYFYCWTGKTVTPRNTWSGRVLQLKEKSRTKWISRAKETTFKRPLTFLRSFQIVIEIWGHSWNVFWILCKFAFRSYLHTRNDLQEQKRRPSNVLLPFWGHFKSVMEIWGSFLEHLLNPMQICISVIPKYT